MSHVDLALQADGWTARLLAAPATAVNRRDALFGSLLYVGAGGLGCYLAFLMGSVAGAMLEHLGLPEPTRVVVTLLVVLAMASTVGVAALAEVVRRGLHYTLDARPSGLGVTVERRGLSALIPMTAAQAGAVTMPSPWPAAIDGDPSAFRIPWTVVRGLSLQPHSLDFTISAERVVSVAIRGHTYEELLPLEKLVEACLEDGDPSQVPDEVRALLQASAAPTG